VDGLFDMGYTGGCYFWQHVGGLTLVAPIAAGFQHRKLWTGLLRLARKEMRKLSAVAMRDLIRSRC
jgi:hypothetical protein